MAQENLTRYVDPFIGTGGHGHTYPGVSLPHGLVQLSPDTDIHGWDWCSGYHYSDSSIMGFSHTHLSGTGCADYGDILFMPTCGPLKTNPGGKGDPDSGYRSRFSHKNENAQPGYYSVLLKDYNIKAELTATQRAGFHKYTFPANERANIIIDLVHGIDDQVIDSQIEIVDDHTVRGYRRSAGWAKDHCVYFYAEFSQAFKSFGVIENNTLASGKKNADGKAVKGYVKFEDNGGVTVLAKVGISHSSAAGAQKNLETEIPGWDFDKTVRDAQNAWQKELSLISVTANDKKNRTIFYTALYHALLNPNVMSDVDGSYMGMDRKLHSLKNRDMYTVFSLWDTFRAEHPLFTIIEPDRDNDMVASLLSKYEENGLLPVWELASNETGTMIGYHAIPVIVDAYFKGILNYDVEEAFQAMKKSAMQDHLGLKYYKEMGYIPSDLESESVSKTLAYAYDDWCIAKMAKALGKEDDYAYFINRAKFYTNVFDPSTSLMRAKRNGRWFEPFDPFSVSGNYTEANAWQYSFFVPQDVNGLIRLMGGDEKFAAKLDELFTTNPKLTGRFQSDITGLIGQYAHGNEPSHHMAYLYNFVGQSWNTQERVHQIMTTLYHDDPDGLSGNEDCGQMSAWFVLSALGFYPVTPGSDDYIIGTPLFPEATINIGEGKSFKIIAHNLSESNFYIQSAKLDGKVYPLSYLKHKDIVKGGELVFEMGPQPGQWGKAKETRPVSSINTSFVPVPYLESGERVFRDSTIVAMATIDDSQIYYSLDGSDPVTGHNIYKGPIQINDSAIIKVVARKNDLFSKVITARYNKVSNEIKVSLGTAYSSSYTGGGPLGLVDGIRGTMNFHTDPWQGYEGVDLDAVIDLGHIQKIVKINAHFLQNTDSWIFYPKAVTYFISTDGKKYQKVFETTNDPLKKNSIPGLKEFPATVDGQKARFVKVIAKNVGKCPMWHKGAGDKAWLFVDEISIE